MTMRDPFESFSKLAFRVEALPFYASSGGVSEELVYYQKHGTVPSNHNLEWSSMVKQAVARGARVARLRLVSTPLSEYEKYEIDAGYKSGIMAGEEVRIADPTTRMPSHDFWLYDNRIMEEMRYDDLGNFIGSDVRDASPSELATAAFYWNVFELSNQVVA